MYGTSGRGTSGRGTCTVHQVCLPRKVWVAEAGYCSDTMYEDKLKEKELQHKRRLRHVVQALLAYGYEVIAVPIILGLYGTIL